MSFVVDEEQINPHQAPAAIAARKESAEQEEIAAQQAVQRLVKQGAKELVARIRELKKLRAAPGQPGWQVKDAHGASPGFELEEDRGLATLLCVSRSRSRGRYHPVVLPRVLLLPPLPGKFFGRKITIETRPELHRLADAEVAARFPLPPDPYDVGQLIARAEEETTPVVPPPLPESGS